MMKRISILQAVPTNDRRGYLMKLDPSGRNVIFSTYTPALGTLAIDKSHNIYLAGIAFNTDFPQIDSITPFLGDGTYHHAFVMKFASSGGSLIYSTLLAGSNSDSALGLAVDDAGNAYVTGVTASSDFPVMNAYQAKPGGGQDIFLAKITDDSTASAGPLETSPGLITFQYIQGAPGPGSQSVAVTGPEQYSVSTNAAWLSATPTGPPAPPNNVQIM